MLCQEVSFALDRTGMKQLVDFLEGEKLAIYRPEKMETLWRKTRTSTTAYITLNTGWFPQNHSGSVDVIGSFGRLGRSRRRSNLYNHAL